jgi:menaquinone-dependent protoporphyrinogen IX oxidase
MKALIVYDSTYGHTEQIAHARRFPREGIHGVAKTPAAFENFDVAAFDTRIKRTIFGYAAPKIAKTWSRTADTC